MLIIKNKKYKLLLMLAFKYEWGRAISNKFQEMWNCFSKCFQKKEINILFGNADKQIEGIPIIGKDFSEIYIKTGYSIGIEYCKNNKIKFIRIEV